MEMVISALYSYSLSLAVSYSYNCSVVIIHFIYIIVWSDGGSYSCLLSSLLQNFLVELSVFTKLYFDYF